MVHGDDDVPSWVRQRAVELFDEHQAELPIAELRYDSLLDEAAGPTSPRTVLFGLGEHEVRVTFSPPADGPERVELCISPPGRYRLVVRLLDTDDEMLTTDEDGCTAVAAMPHRPGSLLVAPPGADTPAWRTAWTRW